mgnify:CR=1 FL=1
MLISDGSKEEHLKGNPELFSELSILSKDKIVRKDMPKMKIQVTSEVISSIITIILSLGLLVFYFFNKDIFDCLFDSYDKDMPVVTSCDPGYYIPTNDKSECKRCSITYCTKCSGTTRKNTCQACVANYEPVRDRFNRIKECVKSCEKGIDYKCVTCSGEQCGKCNLGYILYKGKCLDNFSIKGFYRTKRDNQSVILINRPYSKYIKELIVDGKAHEASLSITFPKKGEHIVLMILNDNELESGELMFYNVSNLFSIEFSTQFRTDNMKTMKGMFKNCKMLETLDITNFNTKKVTDLSYMFQNCIALESVVVDYFDTINVRDISYMFANCSKLISVSISYFKPYNVINMRGLFYGCSGLELIDLENFAPKKAQYMSYMFAGCSSLPTIDFSFMRTESTKDMSYMFQNCSKLTKLNLSVFDTRNVNNMEGMFEGCSSLPALDLKNFDTKNVKNMNKMFYGCQKLEKIDISNFEEIKGNPKFAKSGIFDHNSSKNGKMKVNEKFYDCVKKNIPSKWEIEFDKKNSNQKKKN